jgi:hypothetical protein
MPRSGLVQGPLGVVECHPVLDDPPGLETVTDLLELDRLLLQAPLQPFDEDVVEVTATPIHRGAAPNFVQCRDPSSPGELAALDALIRVKRRFEPD